MNAADVPIPPTSSSPTLGSSMCARLGIKPKTPAASARREGGATRARVVLLPVLNAAQAVPCSNRIAPMNQTTGTRYSKLETARPLAPMSQTLRWLQVSMSRPSNGRNSTDGKLYRATITPTSAALPPSSRMRIGSTGPMTENDAKPMNVTEQSITKRRS